VTFPIPDYDDAALAHLEARRREFNTVCPRHPDDPDAKLAYWKDLYVGTEGDMHTVGTGIYADGCMARVELDTDDDATWSYAGPVTR
jgi:hypothetical protein